MSNANHEKMAIIMKDYEVDCVGAPFDEELDLYGECDSSVGVFIRRGEIASYEEIGGGVIKAKHNDLTITFPEKFFKTMYQILPVIPQKAKYLSLSEYSLLKPLYFHAYLFGPGKFWALSRDDLSIDMSNPDKRVAVVRKCKLAEYGVSWVAAIDFDTRGTAPVNTPDPSFDGYMIDGNYVTTDEDINEFVKDIC